MGRRFIIGLMVLMVSATVQAQLSGGSRALMKARYLLTEKLYGQALDELSDVHPAGDEAVMQALVTGEALAGLKRYPESNEWLRKVTGDRAAEASYRMALNYMALKDPAMAIECLSKHLADPNHRPKRDIVSDPAFSDLDSNRDWIHLWQNDWYSRVEQQEAEARYLSEQGRPDDARDLIRQVLAGNERDPSVWFTLARMDKSVNDERAFRNDFDRAWQLSAGNVPFREELLSYATGIEYYDKVNTMAAEILRADPTNPDVYIARALARIVDGRASMTGQEMSDLEEAGIAPAELYYRAGKKIAETIPLQAEAWLSRAIDDGKLDARYYYARGLVRERLQEADSALSDMAMSLDINPNQPDLYMDRARIRYAIGDKEGACHDWRKALELGSAEATDKIYRYCRE
jgi:tetratricopeptide (TPR) repeat protein